MHLNNYQIFGTNKEEKEISGSKNDSHSLFSVLDLFLDRSDTLDHLGIPFDFQNQVSFFVWNFSGDDSIVTFSSLSFHSSLHVVAKSTAAASVTMILKATHLTESNWRSWSAPNVRRDKKFRQTARSAAFGLESILVSFAISSTTMTSLSTTVIHAGSAEWEAKTASSIVRCAICVYQCSWKPKVIDVWRMSVDLIVPFVSTTFITAGFHAIYRRAATYYTERASNSS